MERRAFILGMAATGLLPGCGRRALDPDPPLGSGRLVAPGVRVHEVRLPSPAGGMAAWIYLPDPLPAGKLPCVLIAPAGSNLVTGMALGDGDRPEHLPYARAGMAVVAYDLDGAMADNASDSEVQRAAEAFMHSQAGRRNADAALQYALKRVPAIDCGRIFAAGHSSAATVALVLAEHYRGLAGCIAYAPCCYLGRRLPQQMLDALSSRIAGYDSFILDASPVHLAAELKCPLFLFHAEDDDNVPASDNADFAEAVSRYNRKVTFARVPSGGHYDSMLGEGIPTAIQWMSRQPRATAAPGPITGATVSYSQAK